MLTIGCHLSTHYGYERMAEEAKSIDANTFQYFTRNPRGGAQRELDRKDIDAFNVYAKDNGIVDVMGYAPYDLEPANPDEGKRDFARAVMLEDIVRLKLMPGSRYLLRPGSARGISKEDAIANIAGVLTHALEGADGIPVLLANMPGEGSQVGSTFEELAAILGAAEKGSELGICLDASAAYAAGYDIKGDLDGVLESFDSIIGLKYLKAVHLNDIKEGLGAHADRHARIGEGQVGFDALAAMTVHPKLKDLPFYLEEPKADLVMYEQDIARIRAYGKEHG